ncbi:MAG: OpgC domain-containing protein, partial [Terriglobales bacterium]
MAITGKQIAGGRSRTGARWRPTTAAPTIQRRPHSSRLPELDALRGLMLVGMTLTHLPTQASHYSNQCLGFVSWAEGFVLLSALLTGRVYGGLFQRSPWRAVFNRLWRRSAKLYGYHLALLAVAFTAVAAVAVHTQKPALLGLLDFYLAHHALAVVTSLLLLYCPPLLDILPMYIVLLLLTPFLLGVGQRWGWKFVLLPSALLWLTAQFGARAWVHSLLVQRAGFPIPVENLGAFNLLAWQFLWAFGLWAGVGGASRLLQWFESRWVIALAALLATTFLVLRYQWPAYFVFHPVDQGNAWVLFDKWQLGGLRLLNFAALGVLFTAVRPYIAHRLAWRPLVLLGKSSLEIFCVQVLFCFAALSLVGDGVGVPAIYQTLIVTLSLAGLCAVA